MEHALGGQLALYVLTSFLFFLVLSAMPGTILQLLI
jgi:hypothetical protein